MCPGAGSRGVQRLPMGYLSHKLVHLCNDKRRVPMQEPVQYILSISMYDGYVWKKQW